MRDEVRAQEKGKVIIDGYLFDNYLYVNLLKKKQYSVGEKYELTSMKKRRKDRLR